MGMTKFRAACAIVAAFVFTVYIGTAAAAPSDQSSSLEKCQKTAQKEVLSYTSSLQKSVASCLMKIAGEVVKEDQAVVDVSGATSSCLSKFHKIGRADSKSIAAKTASKVTGACDAEAAGFGGDHSSEDVLGTGTPNVDQPLDVAGNLGNYCGFFATGASTVAEWIDCLQSAAECEANQQISLEFPRAIEWLTLMDTEFDSASSSKKADAQAALQSVLAALDTDFDGEPDIKCGPGLVPGVDPIVPATGVTLCYNDAGATIACAGTGQDGELQFGRALSFLDNGDGTITDLNTGLVWEKKSDDDSIHDKDLTYSFGDAAAVHVAALNSATFADYDDWRVPNVKELGVICDYSRPNNSVLPVEFNTGCLNGCTVTTCSCAVSGFRWSSTPHDPLPTLAWAVSSSDCDHSKAGQTVARGLRAVRGGP